MTRLNKLNLSQSCLAWFRSYLFGRFQRVKYNNVLSDAIPISAGVAQGSVLGPQLFTIYIDDLIKKLPLDGCVVYADDVTLIGKGRTADEARRRLQDLLDIVAIWSHENSLTLNISKCHVMFISANIRDKTVSTEQPILLNGLSLKTVDHITTLGVTITNDLSWSSQVLKVCSKINGRLGVLHRIRHVLNTNMRLRLCNAFVLPVFTYCLPIWGNCTIGSKNILNKFLRKCIRYVLNNNKLDFSKDVFSSTNICNFNLSLLIANVTTIFKIIHSKPIDDFTTFVLLSSVSQRTSRAAESYKIVLPRLRNKCNDLCFLIGGGRDWNSLPNVLTSITNCLNFQSNLNEYIKSQL
jgi:hypothetical protein